MMTLTQYIESSCWSEASNDELMANLQKRLEKFFWKEQFSLGECKSVHSLGYGVSDNLGYMMGNVCIELGYYDDSDEEFFIFRILC